MEECGVHLVVVHLLLERHGTTVKLRERLQRLLILHLALGGIANGLTVLGKQLALHQPRAEFFDQPLVLLII